ncbi:MAG: triosephosphate isomerase (TIM) [Parcubacteria group bacterium Gr01-1014_8]|nr:MAG: triosephosphate isomerase (TIM) [Parcubacteria group bacterium Gr01-1014_8]
MCGLAALLDGKTVVFPAPFELMSRSEVSEVSHATILRMSKCLVIANWKMNPPTFREAKLLLEATKKSAEKANVSLVVAPPSLFLRELRRLSRSRRILFAAQHAHFEEGGAHTGEISIQQVRDAKAGYVLIGHAERRARGETNDDTRQKVGAALANGLIPVLCVGETKRTASGDYFPLIAEQIRVAFTDVPAIKLGKVVIVYEPLWTIGTDKTMDPRSMHEMSIFIRKTIVDSYGQEGHKMKILYGGSIDATNAGAMLQDGDVHGLLVGRASINAVEFAHLLQAVGNS